MHSKEVFKMFKKKQKLLILFVVISVGTLLLFSKSYAAPTVKLVVNPSVLDISVGSESIALTARASGSNLQFEWKLLGPGKFEGSKTESAVFYKPPDTIEGKSAKVIITIKVTDDKGEDATESVIFNIKQKGDDLPVTPSPTPIPSSTIVIGNVVITQPKDGASVPASTVAAGTYTKEVKDDIWVFVCPEKAPGKCWPQSDDAASEAPAWKKKDGTWAVTCYFGGPPQSYEIVVYTTTPSASKIIGDLMKEWYKNNDYPGIHAMKLPDGLNEISRIEVKKKK